MLDTIRGRITIPWNNRAFQCELPKWEFTKKIIVDPDGKERNSYQAKHESGCWISGDEQQAFIIQASLPRVLFGDNTNLIKTEDDLNQSLDALRLLMLQVLEYDNIPRWTRLDLVWNFLGDIDEYIATFQNTKHPSVRSAVRVYKGQSITWGGKYTTIQIYDKCAEKGFGQHSVNRKTTIVRAELRKTIRTSKQDLGTNKDLTMQLCKPTSGGYLPDFKKLYNYYRQQMVLLSPKQIPEFSTRSPLDFVAYIQANMLTDHNDTPLLDLYLTGKSKASKYRIMRDLKSRVLRHKFISFHSMLPEEQPPKPVGYSEYGKTA